MTDQQDLVHVKVVYREGRELPHAEGLWAQPVDAHEGGGAYRLENHAFMVPLAAGDVVRAELDGHGTLQVTDVVEPVPALLTTVEIDEGSPSEDVNETLERWSTAGALWTEGSAGYLTTVWAQGMSEADILRVIGPDIDARLIKPRSAVGPEERTRAALADDVQFELDRTPPEVVRTDYWAPDDPTWRELGKADPDFLAFVQRLAGEDARVARALEKGQHDRVLTYIGRITAEDPRELPPLEGPIFED
jgi:hypothetical protein